MTNTRLQNDPTQEYFETLLPKELQAQLKARQAAQELSKTMMSLTRWDCQILEWLVASHGSTRKAVKKIVEIGTLTGVSALSLWLGSKKQAQVWSLEKDPIHHRKAMEVLNELPSSEKNHFHFLLGDAPELLEQIKSEGPFDVVFIDANKSAYLEYLDWALANLAKGGMILGDNVFLHGAVASASTETPFSDKQVKIMREFNQRLFADGEFTTTILPTSDGLLVAIKN